MYTMFDLFRQAQGGAAFDNIARAYGMSPEQMRAATAALTPAFMQGFQRNVMSDEGAQRFADLFQTDAYARAFEVQAAALDPVNRPAGENALGAIFGNKDVSRAVAAQAAAASGVQAQIIRQVLPVLASILMGGFVKSLQGAGVQQGAPAPAPQPAPSAPPSPFPGPLGDMLGQIFGSAGRPQQAPGGGGGRSQSAGHAEQQAQPQGSGNPFQDWMESFSGGRGAGQPANPMGEMMTDILGSMFGGAKAAAPEIPEPAPAPAPGGSPAPAAPAAAASPQAPAQARDAKARDAKPRQAEPAQNPFDDMISSGRELTAQNAKAMEAIFDSLLKGGGR